MRMTLQKFFFSWLLSLSCVLAGSAQGTLFSLTGKVTDAETQQPVPFATVTVVYEKNGTTADAEGNYKLLLPYGTWLIKFSSVNHLAFRKQIFMQGDKQLNASLNKISNQLNEVIVTATESERKVQNVSMGVEFLSIKGIKKIPVMMGEVDLLRSIQLLPGVTSVGEGANGVNIRGGNVDQNLIYVDDMVIFNPTHMFGLFSVFSADAIQDVELYKGSIPAQFGGRTASVMNIRMKKPVSDSLRLSGGIGIIANRLNIETPIIKNKLNALVSARLSYNDFWLDLFSFPQLKGARANFYDIATKFSYRPNAKNNFSLSTYLSNDNYRIDSLFALANIVARSTDFKYGHQNAALQWNHFFSPSLNLDVTAAFSRYSTRTTTPDSSNRIELLSSIEHKNLKAALHFTPNERHTLNFGVSGIRYDIRPGSLNENVVSAVDKVILDKEQSWELAAFASEEFKLSPQLKIEAGLRFVNYLNMGQTTQRTYDSTLPKSVFTVTDTRLIAAGAVEKSYTALEPRLIVRWLLDEKRSLKFGYNRMNQFVQLLTNNTTPLPISRWKTANSNLRPQQSDFYSIGYNQEINEKWEFSVENYLRNTAHIVDYAAGADLQLNNQVETILLNGKGRAYGLEVMVTKKRGELTGWMNYTYARSLEQITGDFPAIQQLNKGNWFPSNYDRPHTLNAVMNIEPDRHNSFSFVFTYATGRPFTAPSGYYLENNTKVLIYSERNNDRVSDYHRLDFSWTIKNATLRKKRWEGSWVFAVYNLYGRRNAYSYFFKQGKDGVAPYKLSIFANPLVSLTYNFVFQ